MILGVTLFINALSGQTEYAIAQPIEPAISMEECKMSADEANASPVPFDLVNSKGQRLKIVFACWNKPNPS